MLRSRAASVTVAMLCTALIGCAAAPVSGATRGLTLGFSASSDLTGGTSATRAPWIQRALAEGASIVRVNVDWSRVAPPTRPRGFDPADPSSAGYRWASVDDVVRDLSQHGLNVLLTIWNAPSWAQAANRPRAERAGTWRPDPAQFGQFAKAAALRYAGDFPDPHGGGALPRVHLWQAWNEPNLDFYLSPQWVRAGRGWAPVAPALYRRLLNAFYSAVKGVDASNSVVMAGTGPYGEPLGGDPVGQERIQPVAFYRYVFSASTHLDAVDHHPYGVGGPTWHALNRDDVAVPDVYKIARALNAGLQAGHVLPRGPKSMWVSEIGWSSKPPNPRAVPVLQDARWLEQAMYVLWKQGVDAVLPLEIGDPPPIPNYSSVFESGLYYIDGRPKPLAQAFRFPFVTERLSRSRIRVWTRAPQTGQLLIQARRSGRWRTISTSSLARGQVLLATVALSGAATLRAQLSSQVSLTWNQRG